jgi:hypothetical protein
MKSKLICLAVLCAALSSAPAVAGGAGNNNDGIGGTAQNSAAQRGRVGGTALFRGAARSDADVQEGRLSADSADARAITRAQVRVDLARDPGQTTTNVNEHTNYPAGTAATPNQGLRHASAGTVAAE